MANYWLRSNLASPNFPFVTEFWGRSIIVPQYDQNYDRTTLNVAGVNIDKGIPQAFYMHNVFPTPQGYQSIGYNNLVAPLVGHTDFDEAYSIQTANKTRVQFVPAQGKNYIYDASVGNWVSTNPITDATFNPNMQVTTAFVNGETYIFYSGYGCFKYDLDSKSLVSVTLTGLAVAEIVSITGANGYMIAATANGIAWSSLVDPTDFTPDLATGAGGGSVNDAKGKILACLQINNGVLVYCDTNIVFGRYTGNVNFPYAFKEVPGSSGIENLEQVTWQSNLQYHTVWTDAGILQIDGFTCISPYPELTDFFGGKVFEDFNETTLTLTSTYLDTVMTSKLHMILERFLVVSYGQVPGVYTHAVIFDTVLKRWGKVKVNHIDCFEWNFPVTIQDLTYDELTGTYDSLTETYEDLFTTTGGVKKFKDNFAFLQVDGTVVTVNFNVSEITANGVLLCGKFQFDRADVIEHQQCSIETVGNGNNFDYYIIPTYDGKTLQPAVKGFLMSSSTKVRQYAKIIEGDNISALFIGAFNMNSYVMNFTPAGSR